MAMLVEPSRDPGPTEFLDHLREVAERIRRGEDLSPDELRELKAENRRRAQAAEAAQDNWCDSMPTWVGAIHTSLCNLRCTYCNQAYGKVPERRMSDEVYAKTVSELYPVAERVQFSTAGEPMMTPHLDQRLIDVERMGARLEVISNATLFGNDDRVARIARITADLTVSMDGATKNTFEELRAGADFEQVVSNVRRYHRARQALAPEQRGELSFRFIVMKQNLEEMSLFVDLISEFEPQRLHIVHLVLFEEEMRGSELGPLTHLHGRFNELRAEVLEKCARLGIDTDLPPAFGVEPGAEDAVPVASAAESASAAQVPQGSVEAPPTQPVEAPAPSASPASAPAGGGTTRSEMPRMAEPSESVEPVEVQQGIPCWWPWQRVLVGPSGEVVPCCMPNIFMTGHAGDSSFFDQWNSLAQRELRWRVNSTNPHDICASCFLVHRSPDGGGNFDHID